MLKLICLLFSFSLAAQVIEAPINTIDFMQNPSRVEWREITTEHFQLIFPEALEKDAQKAAHLLETSYPYVTRSLDEKPPRISLVLQAHTTESNGFVTLAPRRSEFFMTPPVNPVLGNTEWIKTLSIHEFRHVVQFQKGRRGFSNFLYFVLGEVGQALGLAFTAPPWLFEGDAVGIETAYTEGGRGRLPLFERDLRTLLLSDQDYNYDKAHLGSFKHYIPNHYIYGYFYTSFLRNHYGDLFLSHVMNSAADSSYNPLSFYNSMDRLLPEGDFEDFYRHVIRELTTEWKARLEKLSLTEYEVKSPEKKYGWTNYLYPQQTSSGILALKNGLSFIDHFVLIKDGKEKLLFYPGILNQEYPFKVRGDLLAWVELDIHPRWGYQDFSCLRIFDVKNDSHLLRRCGLKIRLAVLDHSGKKMAAVEWGENQNQRIHILDLKGNSIKSYPYPSERVISSLDWIDEDHLALVIRDAQDKKSLVNFNLSSSSEKELIAPTMTNLGFVSVEKGEVFIESPESGIDNIYHVGKKLTQITTSAFGAYAPELRENDLIYNEYTPEGMIISKKKENWSKPHPSEGSFLPYYEKFAASEEFSLFSKDLEKKEDYTSSEYSEFNHALNLHSWLILAPPLTNTLTLQAYSRDILNNFSLSGGVSYNLNEQTTQGFVGLSFSHYYPVFDLRAGYGGRRQEVTRNSREFENRWEEGTLEAGMQIPWNSIQGRFTQSFTLRSFAKIIKVTNKLSSKQEELTDNALFSPGLEMAFGLTARKAHRDIYTPVGFTLGAKVEEGRDISGDNERGAIQSVDSRFFLPGLMKHHSFFHQLAYEKQRDNFYQYESQILYPRGTSSPFLDEFFKYSGNYTLPLFYPDWNLSRYLYVKRIYGNAFYDVINGRVGNNEYRASSAGWELVFEISPLRLAFPLGLGVRGSYPIEGENDPEYEVFLATTLTNF